MHKLTFYPLGNADCCKVDIANGKKLLFNFANVRDSENKKRFGLIYSLPGFHRTERRAPFKV